MNDLAEVFAVLDGSVRMFYRENGVETSFDLAAGDIFYALIGTEHYAHPQGEARILMIDSIDSV